MERSSICLLTGTGAHSPFALELGRRVRLARRALSLTQAELGQPLTKSYVSAIERGRTLPSLPALLLLSERLGLAPGELLSVVNPGSTVGYTAGHEHPLERPATAGRRRALRHARRPA